MQEPSVGRIVHYLSRGSADGKFPPACRAAIITEVPTDVELGITQAMREHPETREMLPNRPVSLAVLNPTGLFFDQWLEYDEDGTLPGTWHWPERMPTDVHDHDHQLKVGAVRTDGVLER